jgi:hypothetical protein
MSCGVDGVLGECVCRVPRDAGFCTTDREWCNGADDDCDGAIDEGHVCPWPFVEHTEELEGSVWVLERRNFGERPFVLRRILPEPTDPPVADIGLGGLGIPAFMLRSDGLHYSQSLSPGVWRHVPGHAPAVIPTPGCESGVEFGFDAADQVVYRCLTGLYRAGALVAESVRRMDAVLGTGHLLGVHDEPPYTLALLSPEGDVISRPPLESFEGFVATSYPPTVQGDSAWVAFHRRLHSVFEEIVVFRVSATTGAWDLVRRLDLGTDPRTFTAAALPDGRVLRVEEQRVGHEWTHRLHEHRTDGSVVVHALQIEGLEIRLLVRPPD